MTTELQLERGTVSASSSTARSIVVLGWKEARRIVLSPVYGVVIIFMLAMGGLRSVVDGFSFSVPSAAVVYDIVTFLGLLYGGLLTYLAAHLVATSSRRTHADNQLAASALSSRSRGGALCLGVLFGPGLIAAILMVMLAWIGSDVVLPDDQQASSLAELAQIALTVIGAGLFAVMVATWLRFPGSLLIGLSALMVGTTLLIDPARGPDNTLPWLAPYSTASNWSDEAWTSMGSQSWHAVYLAGLCGLAACAVMMRRRESRGRWMLVSAAVLTMTAAAGWIQL